MILTFDRDVLSRLADIERKEGSPPEETVRQAVGVWTMMNAEDRRWMALVAMRNALRRIHEGDQA